MKAWQLEQMEHILQEWLQQNKGSMVLAQAESDGRFRVTLLDARQRRTVLAGNLVHALAEAATLIGLTND